MAFSNFIPTLWSARLLEHLNDTLVARQFFNREWEGEILDRGDKVKINQIGKINIFEYQRGGTLPAPHDLDGVQQELEIDFARAFNFKIDDIDNAQSKPKLMNSAMQRSAVDLAAAIEAWLFQKLIDGAQVSNTITAPSSSADDIYVILTRLRTMLGRANIPVQGRLAAMPPEIVERVLQDDRFVKTGGANAEGRLESGVVARAAGFGILEVNTIPGNNRIIAGHSVSATMAEQIQKTEAYRVERGFSDGLKGLYLAGARVTRSNGVAVATINLT